MRIDEEIYTPLYADEPSRPNIPVNVLVGLEMMKDGNGWSDQEMYEKFCFNLQVRYAVGLRNLAEGHFDLRTVYNFRQRLSLHTQETGQNLFERTFEQVTDEQIAAYALKTNQQRMDSTQIGSNIREMSRLQLLVEVVQRVYRELTRAGQQLWAIDFEPYLKGSSGQYLYRLKGRGTHQPYLESIGDLMQCLVSELAAQYSHSGVYQLLTRVFAEHFKLEADGVQSKAGQELSADSLQSPVELIASYRKKGDEAFIGYVTNATETCHPDNDFQLILTMQTEPNTTDIEATMGALKRPFGNDKLPVRGHFRVATMMIGSATRGNLRRIWCYQAEKRTEAAKKMKQATSQSPLFQFFSRQIAAFLHLLCSVVGFNLLHPSLFSGESCYYSV